MSKLDIFVLPHCGAGIGDIKKLEELFSCFDVSFNTNCTTYDEINNTKKSGEWFFVIYDNEIVDVPLLEALPDMLEVFHVNVWVFYKRRSKEDKFVPERSPRMFRSDIKLQSGSLIPLYDPEKKIETETILDGWIIEEC